MRSGRAIGSLIAALLLAATAFALGGCSRERPIRCGSDASYLEAETAGQLRIPDDLSVPDEADSLRIPGPAQRLDEDGDDEQTQAQPCLQESPALSENQ
jgi:uncharacterized lipoprotein